MSETIDFDTFWKLCNQGIKEEARMTYDFYTVPMAYPMIECGIVTLQNLLDNYKDYLRYWNSKYAERDAKFVGKKDELKNIGVYLQEGMFKQTFTLPPNSRDHYFFGNYTNKELQEKHNIFLNNNKLQ